MKVIFLTITIFFFLISCVSIEGNRRPAQQDEASEEKVIIDFYKLKIKEFIEYKDFDRYVILKAPIRSVLDISNGKELADYLDKGETLRNRVRKAFLDDAIDLQKLILNNFSSEERKLLVHMYSINDFMVGSFIYPAAFEVLISRYSFGNNVLLTEDDLQKALIEFPESPSGVKYIGSKSKMDYTNKKLREHVEVISHYLLSDKVKFRDIFFNLPSHHRKKFTKNNYLSSESSKVEPFDLVLHQLTKYFYALNIGQYPEIRKPINFIELKRAMKKALAQALLVSNQDDIYAWQAPTISILKNKENFIVLCSNGIFETSNRYFSTSISSPESQDLEASVQNVYFNNFTSPNSILEKWSLDSPIIDLLDKGSVDLNYRCGINSYKFNFKSIKDKAIPQPKPLRFDESINVLMTIALTQEMGASEREVLKNYLVYLKDWDVVNNYQLVDTRTKFRYLFKDMDIYVPISHAMDVNYFMIGTEKSNYLHLKKTFNTNSGDKTVNLYVLLPSQGTLNTNSVTYNVNSLSKMYKERRDNNKGSLFLLNLSCSSETTLATWTHVYRMSVMEELKKDPSKEISDFDDLPYIIASTTYFDTNSQAALARHINYPLESIQILATGGSPRDVVNFLEKPIPKNFINRIIKFIDNFDKKEAEAEQFFPVFNLDLPRLLTYGGYHLTVTNKKTNETQVYQ